ncbi:DHH family phosphoesterase [uncultured Ferrimonas sp.]|uniref:DHH family phosphoesterase n=1 Tax=uncultured Ferrimonas sp. TaxID=432640 RepID=UPI002618A816|nr:DHH family phosphoesterase [uncultured Ferrimonas sp.]
MIQFDVFNGDADGIFALLQLRKVSPQTSTLISGVKRDINLLAQVTATAGDKVTVLDISFDKNRADVLRLLEAGATLDYCDHHFAGAAVLHPNLHTNINTGAAWCTSLLVDRHLNRSQPQHLQPPHRLSHWAIAGAFGDNLTDVAQRYGQRLGLSRVQLQRLQRLGELVNYNGYGLSLADVAFAPTTLYQRLLQYPSADDAASGEELQRLQQYWQQDLAQAQRLAPCHQGVHQRIYRLPDLPWARRLSGPLANQWHQQHPHCAIAVLLPLPDGCGDYQVSLRVPRGFRLGADAFCRQFPSGGGRTLAAGINRLPSADVDLFVTRFADCFVRD